LGSAITSKDDRGIRNYVNADINDLLQALTRVGTVEVRQGIGNQGSDDERRSGTKRHGFFDKLPGSNPSCSQGQKDRKKKRYLHCETIAFRCVSKLKIAYVLSFGIRTKEKIREKYKYFYKDTIRLTVARKLFDGHNQPLSTRQPSLFLLD
jgi:hypothetical protein